MLTLLIARHGQTDWNVQGRVQGGGTLNAVGMAQAAALGVRLRGEPLVAAYASPTLRTRQTIRPTAMHHGLAVHQSRLLRDLDYGDYAGVLLSDLERVNPAIVSQWRATPDTVTFPGGERLADLRTRLRRFVARLATRHPDGNVFVVTHDSPVRTLACIALGLSDAHHNDRSLVTPLGSLTILEVTGAKLRLALHRDESHLAEVNGARDHGGA